MVSPFHVHFCGFLGKCIATPGLLLLTLLFVELVQDSDYGDQETNTKIFDTRQDNIKQASDDRE